MGIKETPTNFRVYYKAMRTAITLKHEKAVKEYDDLYAKEKELYDSIKNNASMYKRDYNISLDDYSEFINNEYVSGKFLNAARNNFINKRNNYVITTPLYELYKLSNLQKKLYDLGKEKLKYEKMLDVSMQDYSKILESFYNEVHKKLIIEGKGYIFEDNIGWICINRCKVKPGKRKHIDYQKTRRNKEKLLAEGKRLWNKAEAEYCELHGIEYDAVDYRVYINNEYCYEIPLIGCRLGSDGKCRFEPTARRRFTKDKTDEDMIALCDNDKSKICELPIDIKRKLVLCLKVDDLLYLNFIRNEGQQSAHTPKANRQNRQ